MYRDSFGMLFICLLRNTRVVVEKEHVGNSHVRIYCMYEELRKTKCEMKLVEVLVRHVLSLFGFFLLAGPNQPFYILHRRLR